MACFHYDSTNSEHTSCKGGSLPIATSGSALYVKVLLDLSREYHLTGHNLFFISDYSPNLNVDFSDE